MKDLATVLTRLRAYYDTVDFFGDGAVVLPCTVSTAGDYLAAQQADGSWADVDYLCTASAANGVHWSPYLALDRMQAMAMAYVRAGHPHCGDQAMLQGVENALAHWASVRGNPDDPAFVGPWSVNWWENGVGPQLRFGRIGVMLKEHLSPEAIKVLTDKLPAGGDRGTGQNSLWFTQNGLFRALIVGDAAQFAKLAKQVDGKMAVQTGAQSLEALQVDGSYHGHGELFMSHHYGMALFRDMSLWVHVLRDTAYAVSEETVDTLADYMLNGTRWTIRGEVMELACGYTPCGKGGYARTYYTVPLRRMMELDHKNAPAYRVLLDNIEGRRVDNGLSGFHYMWTSAYASQMRPRYGVNVRMDSRTVKGSEWRATWRGTDYGNLLFWTTAGAVTVVVDGDEYRSVYPTFDWRHTPGATAPFARSSKMFHEIAGDMAMGVSTGRYGATGFAFRKPDGAATTAGTVGYFFFDDEYVALGAGIESDSAVPVHTTLNQTKAEAPCTAGGAVPAGTNGAVVRGTWVHNNQVGYVFPDETGFCVSHLDHNTLHLPTLWDGTYSQFAMDNLILDGTYQVEDLTFSLWLDHGATPRDASYAYIVVPATTAAETAAYAANIPVTVLCNTPAVQAVRHRGLGQTAVNFYQAGEITLNGTRITADAPCSLWWDEKSDTLTAGIPNNAETPALTVTVDGRVYRFTFDPAPYTGRSVTI